MAIAQTITATKPRLEFLVLQVMYALRELTSDSISDRTMENIKTSLFNKWIDQVDIYLVQDNNNAVGGLKMTIDWQKHQLYIDNGDDVIILQGNKNYLHDFQDTCSIIKMHIALNEAKTTWRVIFSDHMSEEQKKRIRKDFNWAINPPPKWDAPTQSQAIVSARLPEYGYEFIIANTAKVL